MIILNFEVKKQRIIKKNTEYLVNHTLHFLEFYFSFDEQWDLFSPKYIIFKHNEKNYLNILTYDPDLNKYFVSVPSVVLKGYSFRFTIYGLLYVGSSEVRITTQEVTIKLHDSGFTTEISNINENDNGNVDIFTTIFDNISNKFDDLIIDDEKIIFKSEGTIVKTVPLSVFLDDYYDKSQTEYFLENKANRTHNHVSSDVTDLEDAVGVDVKSALNSIVTKIRTYGVDNNDS